jgi:competence protein ComEC
VLARYAAAGVPVLTTAACGAWRWRSQAAAAGIDGRCTRREHRRYWHHPLAAGPAIASNGP